MIKRKDLFKEAAALTVKTPFKVRFNETDALGIVWHGNYITYFEDGRESFGKQHGISYLEVQENGFTTPIVKTSCEHKRSLKYGDYGYIETAFIDTPAAKIIFKFKIYNQHDELVCTGESVQVFVDATGELVLQLPEFFARWKQQIGLLK